MYKYSKMPSCYVQMIVLSLASETSHDNNVICQSHNTACAGRQDSVGRHPIDVIFQITELQDDSVRIL